LLHELTVEPALVSVEYVTKFTGESRWQVYEHLKLGIYKGKKSGRRTMIVFAGVKARVAALPDAKFAPHRKRTKRQAAQLAEAV